MLKTILRIKQRLRIPPTELFLGMIYIETNNGYIIKFFVHRINTKEHQPQRQQHQCQCQHQYYKLEIAFASASWSM